MSWSWKKHILTIICMGTLILTNNITIMFVHCGLVADSGLISIYTLIYLNGILSIGIIAGLQIVPKGKIKIRVIED